MKKVCVVLAAMIIGCFASSALANEGDKSAEGSLALGNRTSENDGIQFGLSFGFGYEFLQNLQIRSDLAYLTRKPKGSKSTYRLPIDMGLRYLHPLNEKITLLGQGGLEFSMDDKINQIGLSLGGGAEYALNPKIGIISTVNFHFVPGGYASWNIGAAYHF